MPFKWCSGPLEENAFYKADFVLKATFGPTGIGQCSAEARLLTKGQYFI